MMKSFYLAIFLFLSSLLSASAQNSSIVLKGKVVDSDDGYPLIGVSVIVEGKTGGAITDLDGNYEIKVPKQQCNVTFSYVGYEDKVIL